MLQVGLLNPHLLSLLARIRHTNTLVIADAMFPSWPGIETVDLSLIGGVPTVPQVLSAVLADWKAGSAWMAEEFLANNNPETQREFRTVLGSVRLTVEPHLALKRRVPTCTGLIRTGEMRTYTNIVLESA
ncbi:MAG TPA: RbsD/FucU domain-containing protein [Verrucomicrobiota bacterium]|nr:RbsD/FucU domain-containing protein [Verrucomicrobiota bacterium]